MKDYTLHDLLTRLRLFLEGKCDFSDVREYVYEFYEAETSLELDEALEDVFPILLPYLQFEEAEGDEKRDARFRRVVELLKTADAFFAERAVFGLEFDEIQILTRKFRVDKLITKETYEKKMATLLPAPYDANKLICWARAHEGKNEPYFGLLD